MYLAVDIGTSSMKVGIIDVQGKLIDYGRSFFECRDAKAFDPQLWEKHFSGLLGELDLSRVQAVAISSNGPTLAALDSQGKSLLPLLHWQDQRWSPLSGPSYYLPKVEWLRKNHPSVYKEVSLFLSPSEFLLYRLTGHGVMASSGSEFDSYIWTAEQLDRHGFAREKFPEILRVGSHLGDINVPGSVLSGLQQGTPCFVMGSDFQASLLGTGAVTPGILCDRAGTSEGLNLCVSHRVRRGELRDLPHVIEPLRNSSAILSSTGSIFEWYRHLTGQSDRSYEEILTRLKDEKNDLPYFFPSLKHGGLWEFAGGMLMGLDPHHSRYSLGRAMLDSIGFSIRHGLELLEKTHGTVGGIILCGGQAKSDIWNQMKSDLLGRKLLLPRIVDAELLGCAAAASVGLGQYPSLTQASLGLVKYEKEYSPNDEEKQKIDKKYSIYRRLSKRVKFFYRKKLKIELDKN
ncbi:MAG: FGGY-family carbohydrate kinase [Spirochaetaceae bacterium]|jgi:xylulokinase|nr:FGGY-family carbohydrate kinase [Spirochaetaceae bacterium]